MNYRHTWVSPLPDELEASLLCHKHTNGHAMPYGHPGHRTCGGMHPQRFSPSTHALHSREEAMEALHPLPSSPSSWGEDTPLQNKAASRPQQPKGWFPVSHASGHKTQFRPTHIIFSHSIPSTPIAISMGKPWSSSLRVLSPFLCLQSCSSS